MCIFTYRQRRHHISNCLILFQIPGPCFLAAVFPCIFCENREETCSIWQESRRKMVRIRCNEPVTVYGCRLWQVPVDSHKNRINPATGSIHWNTAAMKSQELHWNRPFPVMRVRPGMYTNLPRRIIPAI